MSALPCCSRLRPRGFYDAKLKSIADTQQSQSCVLGAIAQKLGVTSDKSLPQDLQPRPKVRASPPGPTSNLATSPARIKKLEDLILDANMHNNFIQAFGITDGAYDIEMFNPDWSHDPEAPMQGNEWWMLLEPAYPGVAKWKQVALQNLNIVDTIKPTRSLDRFILAVVNDALADDFTPLM